MVFLMCSGSMPMGKTPRLILWLLCSIPRGEHLTLEEEGLARVQNKGHIVHLRIVDFIIGGNK